MRERVTRFISCLFIASSLLVALFPFYFVLADGQTYIIAPKTLNDGILNNDSSWYFYQRTNSEIDGRMVIITIDSSTKYLFVFNDSLNSVGYTMHYGGSGYNGTSQYTYNSNNNIYYYYYVSTATNFTYDYTINQIASDHPEIVHSGTASTAFTVAFNYTFGNDSVGPGPSWGGPANVMYNTRISGTGQMASQNIDRIVFSPNIDSNGNVLPDNARFQIRAVPLEYSGLTPTDVLSKTYSQAVLNYTDATVLMDRIPANGVYEIKWSEVAETLSIPFSTINSVIQGDDYFYKMGWIYEIRLQIDDYYSEWVKIYTATSSGAQVEEDISNTDTISQELIKNITIINSLNNTETVNWYINDTEINMQEYTEPSEGQKPWWAYLLEAIVNSFNITNNYINEGNDTTINISNTVNNSDDQMNNKINQYQQYEDDFIQDMDDNLTDIDTNVPLLSNSKFVNSAQWVAQQYTRMTNNTVIGSLLGFSLVFGLALIFIGRIR